MSAEIQPNPDALPLSAEESYDAGYRSYRDFVDTARLPETSQEMALVESFRRYCYYETFPATNMEASDVRQTRTLAFAAHHFISNTVTTHISRARNSGQRPMYAGRLSRPAIDDSIASYFNKFHHTQKQLQDERAYIVRHTSNLYSLDNTPGQRRKVSQAPEQPEVMLGLQLSELLHGSGNMVAAHAVDVYLAAVGRRLEETAGLGRLTLHSYDRGTPT